MYLSVYINVIKKYCNCNFQIRRISILGGAVDKKVQKSWFSYNKGVIFCMSQNEILLTASDVDA